MEGIKMEAPPAPSKEEFMAERGKDACTALAEWHRSATAIVQYEGELSKHQSLRPTRTEDSPERLRLGLRIEANLATARADFAEVDGVLKNLARRLHLDSVATDQSRSDQIKTILKR